MSQIKAQYVQACIFTPQDKGGPAQYPAQEQYLYQMFGNAIVELRKLHGPNVPVFLDFCPVAGNSDNLVILEQNGGSILNLPAVQIYAKYSDGTSGQYFLKKGITDVNNSMPIVNESKALAYMQALLYRLSPTPETLLCKLLPPLCSLGWYFWAAAGAYSVYRTTQARNVGKIVWGAASALTINEFIQRGGLKELGSKVGIGRIIQEHEPLKGARNRCNTLKYTTSSGPGTCSYNGGIRLTEVRKRNLAEWRTPMKRELRKKGLSVPMTDSELLKKFRNEIGDYPAFSEWLQQ